MPISTLMTAAFGPFPSGLLDTKNPSIPSAGKLRVMRNLIYVGGNELAVRLGDAVALTLKDDAGTPANVTRVLWVGTFMDGAVAVAHSTTTNKAYLYRFPATMDGWYNSSGVLQSTLLPEPCAVLWTGMTAPPDVSCAEGLGTLYVANTSALDENGLYFATQAVTWSGYTPTTADLAASGTDGSSAGSDTAYFTNVCSFHQALFGVGYGAGNTVGYSSYRPEMLRFSPPNFGNLQEADSIVIGDRVRALRERPVGLCAAGNALFVPATKALFRITGYGRDSWFVETLDERYGATGPKAFVAVGNMFYYWTSRGPARCSDAFGSVPEPLWDAVIGVVGTVANESHIIAGYDSSDDLVWFGYDAGSGVVKLCTFDVRREAFTSGDGDIGLEINCAGVVEPIYASTATPPSGPVAPVVVSTTVNSDVSASYVWTEADGAAAIELSYRVQGTPSYIVLPLLAPGVVTYTATGLTPSTAYEWRVRAVKGGFYSAYAGPTTNSQFTTDAGSGGGGVPPTAPTGLAASQVGHTKSVALTWTYADAGLVTQILRSSDGAYFTQVDTVAAADESYTDTPSAYGTFYYMVRHVATDGTIGYNSDDALVTTTP